MKVKVFDSDNCQKCPLSAVVFTYEPQRFLSLSSQAINFIIIEVYKQPKYRVKCCELSCRESQTKGQLLNQNDVNETSIQSRFEISNEATVERLQ